MLEVVESTLRAWTRLFVRPRLRGPQLSAVLSIMNAPPPSVPAMTVGGVIGSIARPRTSVPGGRPMLAALQLPAPSGLANTPPEVPVYRVVEVTKPCCAQFVATRASVRGVPRLLSLIGLVLDDRPILSHYPDFRIQSPNTPQAMSIRRLKPTPNAPVPVGDPIRADGEDIVFGASPHPGATSELGKIDPGPVFSIPMIGLASHRPEVIRFGAPNRAETLGAARPYKLRGPRNAVKMRDGLVAL